MASQFPPRRILIIDDNLDAADLIAQLLDLHGFVTATAGGGQVGIDLANTFAPDLIMLDLGMPGMDGYKVATSLRANPKFRKIVLVAFTAWGDPHTRAKTLSSGFDYHVTKPIDLDLLLQTVMLT